MPTPVTPYRHRYRRQAIAKSQNQAQNAAMNTATGLGKACNVTRGPSPSAEATERTLEERAVMPVARGRAARRPSRLFSSLLAFSLHSPESRQPTATRALDS